jgi:acetylornithine deacetylase
MALNPSVSLLAELVTIPSVNPMGRESTGTIFGEEALARSVAGYLRSHRVDAALQEVEPGRTNVIAHVDAGAPRTLLLEAHLDTVRTEGMGIDPFGAGIRGGRLYGRGSCDTKGSLAAFLSALGAVMDRGAPLRYNVVFLATADEEYSFRGARHAVAAGLKADFGIAGEPTGLRIVHAHKGVTRWHIATRGLAAHSAYPERGRNAIFSMGQALVRLEQYAHRLRQDAAHPVLGFPSLSVGVIRGGEAVNVIPDRCTIEVDRRTLPGEIDVVAPVRTLLEGIPDCVCESPHISAEGMEVPREAPIVEILGEAVRAATGDCVIEAAHYATNAGVYGAAGIPTLVFGPGDIGLAHTAEEYIALDEYQTAVEIITRLLT